MYSSSTLFVLTLGTGVWGFTYDSAVGEFILSHPDIKIPDKDGQKIYSFNEGNYQVGAGVCPRQLHAWAGAAGREQSRALAAVAHAAISMSMKSTTAMFSDTE